MRNKFLQIASSFTQEVGFSSFFRNFFFQIRFFISRKNKFCKKLFRKYFLQVKKQHEKCKKLRFKISLINLSSTLYLIQQNFKKMLPEGKIMTYSSCPNGSNYSVSVLKPFFLTLFCFSIYDLKILIKYSFIFFDVVDRFQLVSLTILDSGKRYITFCWAIQFFVGCDHFCVFSYCE